MRCSHFPQPSTTCCASPPGRRSSTAGRGRASPAGCSPPCRRDWRLRSRRMGDEQRVSWQELLAQSRDEGRRFIVHADEELSAFVELERQVLTVTFYLASIKAET